MTKKLGDLIRQTTETEGVGDIALIDPEQGYFGFVDVLGDGAQTFYVINDGLGNVEGGWGTLTAGATDTLSRDTVVFSSNSGSLVNFNSGIKTVICALPAEAIVWSPDTYVTNNILMFDGTNFRAKTRAQVAKRVTVDLVATSNVNLASGLVAGGTLDGVILSLTGADDGGPHKVLLTAQSTASQNGVYPVVASGASSRDTDFDTAAKLPTMLKLAVRQGTVGAGTEYLHTTAPGFTLGTTSLTFAKRNGVRVGDIATWAGSNDDFVQQKAGALTNRTPAQAAVDIQPYITSAIPGVTNGSDATAGVVGEYISSQITAGSAVSLTTNTVTNITSISLSAGDWDVSGTLAFSANGATVTTRLFMTIGTASATLLTSPAFGAQQEWDGSQTGTIGSWPIGPTRLSLTSTTTVYLITRANFTTNTLAAYGFICARRVR